MADTVSVTLSQEDWVRLVHGLNLLRYNELAYLTDIIDEIEGKLVHG